MYLKKIGSDPVRIAQFANKQPGWIEPTSTEVDNYLLQQAEIEKKQELHSKLDILDREKIRLEREGLSVTETDSEIQTELGKLREIVNK